MISAKRILAGLCRAATAFIEFRTKRQLSKLRSDAMQICAILLLCTKLFVDEENPTRDWENTVSNWPTTIGAHRTALMSLIDRSATDTYKLCLIVGWVLVLPRVMWLGSVAGLNPIVPYLIHMCFKRHLTSMMAPILLWTRKFFMIPTALYLLSIAVVATALSLSIPAMLWLYTWLPSFLADVVAFIHNHRGHVLMSVRGLLLAQLKSIWDRVLLHVKQMRAGNVAMDPHSAAWQHGNADEENSLLNISAGVDVTDDEEGEVQSAEPQARDAKVRQLLRPRQRRSKATCCTGSVACGVLSALFFYTAATYRRSHVVLGNDIRLLQAHVVESVALRSPSNFTHGYMWNVAVMCNFAATGSPARLRRTQPPATSRLGSSRVDELNSIVPLQTAGKYLARKPHRHENRTGTKLAPSAKNETARLRVPRPAAARQQSTTLS